MNTTRATTIVGSVLVALGLAAAGAFVGTGFSRGRSTDRYVTVKGVAEKQVAADLALWPLRLISADSDLSRAHQQLAASVEKVRDFLTRQGVKAEQIEIQSFRVTDAYANQYRPAGEVAKRFIVEEILMVRSENPSLVLAASQKVGELIAAGVVLTGREEYGNPGPTFLFTKLNDHKPGMIAEATARAREGAEQFARDSRSRLGSIRRATQGVFEILPRDPAQGIQEESQINKRIRVVSTVEYSLKD